MEYEKGQIAAEVDLRAKLHAFIDSADGYKLRLLWSFIKTLFGV